jgi:hypothetical protein
MIPGLSSVELVILAMFLYGLVVVVSWKICSKAGFPGAMGLLVLVPVVNAIFLVWFAFTEWPVVRELKSLKGAGGPPPASTWSSTQSMNRP